MFFSKPRAAARLCLGLSLALTLTACVSTPPRQSFNRDVNAGLKSIAVLPMRPSEAQVVIMNNPGHQFGLIGALVAEANLAGKRDKLRTQLSQAGFDHNLYLRDALGAALEKRGYAVVWPQSLVETSDAKAKREQWGLRKTYPASAEPHAQLDINYGFIGYAAAGATKNAPYRPTVTLSVRMVSPDGKSTLFTDTFIYNNVFPLMNESVTIEPDPRFVYPDFDDLDEADAKSAEGLQVAIDTMAARIAESL